MGLETDTLKGSSPPLFTASFTDHLIELRRRIITTFLVFMLATLLSYPLAQPLLLRIKADLLNDLPLIVIDPTEAVVAYVNVSLLIGFIITLPVMTYNIWAFITPALKNREKKLILYLVVPSVVMFLIGVSFGYFLLIPMALRFLLADVQPLATPMLSLGSTISFVSALLMALGIVFQWPLITAALGKLGIVKSSAFAKYRRHAIVVIVLAAGILTPDPTIAPQLILSFPMIILYEFGIITSKMAGG
jgi:sec-independent protein translocase protein TatC